MQTTETAVQVNPLAHLIGALEGQNAAKQDIVIKGAAITYRAGKIWVQDPKEEGKFFDYAPTDVFHNQVAEKLGIPAKYYDRMMDQHPELLEANINMWLSKDERVKYMLRMFQFEGGNVARAFLSDRFNAIDNYDVLFTALKAIKDTGVNVQIVKAEVTTSRMYLCVTCPEIEIQAEELLRNYIRDHDGVGNGVVSGLVITNSEIGKGSFEIRPRAVIVKCNNGLIKKDESFKRVHLGERMDEGHIVWSERTKKKNFDLIMSQTQDAVKQFLSKDYLGKMIERIAEARKVELNLPYDTVQNVCQKLGIADKYKAEVLKYFLSDGDSKGSGVFQAITRTAQMMDMDSQYEVETAAFSLLPDIKKYDKPFSKN